ncbi:MAG: hypothetical protein HRU47_02770 [Verrucomicrobiales bacterium]|nr:hypothetical protein [Verrucomicrobiales bacterium]
MKVVRTDGRKLAKIYRNWTIDPGFNACAGISVAEWKLRMICVVSMVLPVSS